MSSASIATPQSEKENTQARTTSLRTGLSQKTFERHDVRAWCTAVIILSLLTSIAAIVLGTVILRGKQVLPPFLKDKCTMWNHFYLSYAGISEYSVRHFAFPSPGAAPLLLVLAVNLALTAFLDTHSRVASTALTWLLLEDGDGPKYNVNSRLLTGTKNFGTCKE
jgi:hypothetical protein